MKYLFFIALALIVIACESTNEPMITTPYHISGNVNILMYRTHESGKILGEFYPSYYLSGIKCELLSNGKVIQTTYTKEDDEWDSYYVFDNIEPNGTYQVRIQLNEVMIKTTDEFTLTHDSFKKVDTINTDSLFNLRPDYFKIGQYYYMGLIDTLHNNVFNLYYDMSKFGVFPNPVMTIANLEFLIEEYENYKINITDLKLDTIMSLMENKLQVGVHSLNIDPGNLEDGLYFFQIDKNGEKRYYPFIKGSKGTPNKPN